MGMKIIKSALVAFICFFATWILISFYCMSINPKDWPDAWQAAWFVSALVIFFSPSAQAARK